MPALNGLHDHGGDLGSKRPDHFKRLRALVLQDEEIPCVLVGNSGSDRQQSLFPEVPYRPLENFVEEKLMANPASIGTRAGSLTAAMAEKTGLMPGIAVAVANVDAHVSVPACKVTAPGTWVSVVGTSSCAFGVSKTCRDRTKGCTSNSTTDGITDSEADNIEMP